MKARNFTIIFSCARNGSIFNSSEELVPFYLYSAARYEALPDLVGDLHALVTNALTYNAGNSPIYRRAKKLRTACLSLVSDFVNEWPHLAAASRTMAPVVWPEWCWLTPPEPPPPPTPKVVAPSSTEAGPGAEAIASAGASGADGMAVEGVPESATVSANETSKVLVAAMEAGGQPHEGGEEGKGSDRKEGEHQDGGSSEGDVGAVAATEAQTKTSEDNETSKVGEPMNHSTSAIEIPTVAATVEPVTGETSHSSTQPNKESELERTQASEPPSQSSTAERTTGTTQANSESPLLPSMDNKAEGSSASASMDIVQSAADEKEDNGTGTVPTAAGGATTTTASEVAVGVVQGEGSLAESCSLFVGDIVSARYGNGLTWYTDCRISSVNSAHDSGARSSRGGGGSANSSGDGSGSGDGSSGGGADTPIFTYGIKYNNGSKRSSVQRCDIRLTERTPEAAANAAAAAAAAQVGAGAASSAAPGGVAKKHHRHAKGAEKEKGAVGRPRSGSLTSVTRALAIPSGVSFAAADGPRKRGRPRTASATLEPLTAISSSVLPSITGAVSPSVTGAATSGSSGKKRGPKKGASTGKKSKAARVASPSTADVPDGEHGTNNDGTVDSAGADPSSCSSMPWAGGYRDAEEAAHVAWLQTPTGEEFAARLAAAADRDTRAVLGYVHWTFPDQTVEDQYPSYMMARTLDDLPLGGWPSSSSSLETDASAAKPSSESGNSSFNTAVNGSLEAKGSEAGSTKVCEMTAAAGGDGSGEPAYPATSAEGFVGAAKVKKDVTLLKSDAPETLFKVGLSPEMAAGFPRGVTPRGTTFVAKFGGDEYLGSFPTPEDAGAAYQDSLAYHRQHRQAIHLGSTGKGSSGSSHSSTSSSSGANRLSAGSDGAKTPKKGQSKKGGKAKGKGRGRGKGAKKGATGGAAEAGGSNATETNQAGDAEADVEAEVLKEDEGAEDVGKVEEAGEDNKEEAEDGENALVWPPPPLPRPVDPSVNLLGCAHKWLVEESPQVVPHRMAWGLPDDRASFASTSPSSAALAVTGDEDSTPSAKKAKITTASIPGKKTPALYNKVVTVQDLPPCYPNKYWFVYQYVPDMQWCHLCPLYVDGTFKTGPRMGCPRYKLCPEGRAREVDVPASRCALVEARQCVHSASADKEVFDIPEEAAAVK